MLNRTLEWQIATVAAIRTETARPKTFTPSLPAAVRPAPRVDRPRPTGGCFVGEVPRGGPLLLVAGGSGVVPLMSMLRHRRAVGSRVPARLLYSSRTPEDVIYADELMGLEDGGDGLEVIHTYTRTQPAGWTGYARRIDPDMLKEIYRPLGGKRQGFIAGPTQLW